MVAEPPRHRSGRPANGQQVLPPDEELPELLRIHGSFMAIARLFGVSKSTVSYRFAKLGIRSPGQRGGRKSCAACRRGTEDVRIVRFQLHLSRSTSTSRYGKHAGAVDLCERCWRTLRANSKPAQARRRPARLASLGLDAP